MCHYDYHFFQNLITFVGSYFALVVVMLMKLSRSFTAIYQHIACVHTSFRIFCLLARMIKLTMHSLTWFSLTGVVKLHCCINGTGYAYYYTHSETKKAADCTSFDLVIGNHQRYHLECFILWPTAWWNSCHLSPRRRLLESQWSWMPGDTDINTSHHYQWQIWRWWLS